MRRREKGETELGVKTKAIICYTMFLSLCLSAAPMGEGRRCEWAVSCQQSGPVPSLTSSWTGCSLDELQDALSVERLSAGWGQVFICTSQRKHKTHLRNETRSQEKKRSSSFGRLIFSLSINNSEMSVYCTSVNGNQHPFAAKLPATPSPLSTAFFYMTVFYCMTNWPVTDTPQHVITSQ